MAYHRASRRATILCFFQSLAGILFGWEQSSGTGLFNMQQYSRRFGVCDAAGLCSMPTKRQSIITGILSIGAFIGALSSGAIASRVSVYNIVSTAFLPY
jgi:SP family sugar:H+ symporter-like MFS transporter